MSWRERLLPASFRGAAFRVESHSSEVAGRRVAVHEYPGRDRPFAEDLGAKAKEFEVEAYVIGDDYHAARDALIDACDAPGPGTLVHPYLGERSVACTACTLAERTSEGRMARLTLRFVDSGAATYPVATPDTGAAVGAAADNAAREASRQFYEAFGP